MDKKRIFGSIYILLSTINVLGQTQFWSDTFEDTGAPSSGTRTPSQNFSCGGPPSTNYFFRTNTAGIALQSGTYSGMQGTKFWAAEDVDFGSTCTNVSISPNQQVTWSSINISGKSGLSFRGLFAANNAFASNWEGSTFAPNQDYISVEYRIDGGAWQRPIVFYASTTGQTTTLKLETTGDLIGDGADLTYTFTEYTANIVGTGTTLDLRLNLSSNGTGAEEMAADNFRLFYSTALPSELSEFTAYCENETEMLRWKAESELRFLQYEIEQSIDLETYTTIAIIPSHGKSSEPQFYAYQLPTHNNIMNQVYYRLKMVDLDGAFTYSSTLTGNNQCNDTDLLSGYSYSNNEITLHMKKPFVEFQLFSTLGQALCDSIYCGDDIKKTISLNDTHNQIFILKVTDSKSGLFKTYRIVL